MYYPQPSPGLQHKLSHDQNGWPRGSAYLYNAPALHHPLQPIHHHQNSLSHYSSPPHNPQISPATIPGQMMSQQWQTQLLKYESMHTIRSPHRRAEQNQAGYRASATSSAIPITNPNKLLSQDGSPSSHSQSDSSPPAANHPSSTVAPIATEPRTSASKPEQTTWSTLDMGGVGIKNIPNSSPLFKFMFLKQLFLNHNALTSIPVSICRLRTLEILDVSGNALTALPPELGMCTGLKELLFFDNHVTTVPPQLGTLHQLVILGVEGNPIDAAIKNILQTSGTQALIATLRDSCPNPPEPPPRRWKLFVSPAEHDQVVSDPASQSFIIHCSNILNEKYATEKLYGYTPSWALKWEYRREILIKEIIASRADIVCLQEADIVCYEDFFIRNLGREGYDGVLYQKGRHKGLTETERRQSDGCATLYRTDKYQLLSSSVVEFGQAAMARKDFKKTDSDIWSRVLNKDHLATVVVLMNRQTGQKLVVANVHVLWDPAFRDVKLVQVGLLLDEIDKLVKEDGEDTPPVIVCGDFNSMPDSGVYEYLSTGQLAPDHPDFMSHQYGRYTIEGMRHRFGLKSAYAGYVPQGRPPNLEEGERQPKSELPLTNYTPSFCGTLDYIWYSAGSLGVLGVIEELDSSYVDGCVGFPNCHVPSDHLPITAEFRIKSRKG